MAARRFVTELRNEAFAITVVEGKSSVARIGVGMEPGRMMVKRIDVVPGARRQGVGTKLYERAAQVACEKFGLPLASDTWRSEMAQGFWAKQEAKGRAQYRRGRGSDDYYVLSCPAPKSLAGARARRRR